MLQGERHLRILDMLKQSRTITVKQLCDALEASEATIRRDLATLELEGKLERTHGGAILTGHTTLTIEDSYNQKETMFEAQKQAIAAKAFERLNDFDSIVLDAGTTTLELARLIGQSNLHLTVITNSTTVSSVIAQNPHVELIAVGGKVRLNVLAAVGHLAIEFLRRFNVNKAFVARQRPDDPGPGRSRSQTRDARLCQRTLRAGRPLQVQPCRLVPDRPPVDGRCDHYRQRYRPFPPGSIRQQRY
jgi:DeoR family fructose operon transcriptional repressor